MFEAAEFDNIAPNVSSISAAEIKNPTETDLVLLVSRFQDRVEFVDVDSRDGQPGVARRQVVENRAARRNRHTRSEEADWSPSPAPDRDP
jgi:hypothetical protein